MFPLDAGPQVTLQVASLSISTLSVPAPDYGLDVSGIAVLIDAGGTIRAVGGAAVLTAGQVAGQALVVLPAFGLTTYPELDGAFTAGTSAAVESALPAAAFTLVGSDLRGGLRRTVIIANQVGGVRSYQAFEVTFRAPG
jgi:hypothetical protein